MRRRAAPAPGLAAGVVELWGGPATEWRSTVHELGITQGIIDRARDAAAANGARKVAGLYLLMTPAADFTQDSIEMYFEMLASDDELFKGAKLHFEHKPVAATCLSCSDEFSTDAPQPICPQCGSLLVQLDPDAPMVQLTDIDIDDGADEQG
jgi:hydrogenase nickel incorporation protein HypA/HybF